MSTPQTFPNPIAGHPVFEPSSWMLQQMINRAMAKADAATAKEGDK